MDQQPRDYNLIVRSMQALAHQAPTVLEDKKLHLEHFVVRALGETAVQRFGEGEQGEAAFHLTVHLGSKAVKYGGKAVSYMQHQLQTPLGTIGRTVQDRLDELFGKKNH